MQSIYFLIPLSLLFLAAAVWAIRYAVRSGQFDDLDNAAEQVVLEDKQMRREQLTAHTHKKGGLDVD